MTKTIKVGGRELALLFTLDAMDEIEGLLGAPVDVSNLQDSIVSKLSDRRALVKVLYALAKQGEYAMGFKPDFDLDWMTRNIKPGRLVQMQAAAVEALADGLGMETGGGDDDEEVDVVLAELKKKRLQCP